MSLGETEEVLADSSSGLPSISRRCKTQRATFDRGNQIASCKVNVSLSRRTTAFEVDGALAAAEDNEAALGPEDSVVAVA